MEVFHGKVRDVSRMALIVGGARIPGMHGGHTELSNLALASSSVDEASQMLGAAHFLISRSAIACAACTPGLRPRRSLEKVPSDSLVAARSPPAPPRSCSSIQVPNSMLRCFASALSTAATCRSVLASPSARGLAASCERRALMSSNAERAN